MAHPQRVGLIAFNTAFMNKNGKHTSDTDVLAIADANATATLPKPKQAKKLRKREIREKIEEQLAVALADLRVQLGDKKFRRRIKQAGKLFGRNLVPAREKTLIPSKKGAGKEVLLERKMPAK